MHANAQQCSNCKQTTKVATYDLDIQVPQPELKGKQTVGWLEWTRLYEISGKIKFALKQNAGNCIMFIQPNDARLSSESFTTKDGTEVPPLKEESDQLKVGLYYTNLPPIGDVSRFGDYITTGYVKSEGDAFVMHIEIQTACERKVIAQATVPFDSLKNSEMTANVATQAAAQLSPLSEKIKKIELEERQKNKSLSLYKMEGEPMKLTPVKTTLKARESTDFTIELKDCDNVPLQGREILFTETEFGGLKVYGTMGGTVTPVKVVTDANGKATARFTLKAGAKEAIINAHSPGNNVKGCSSILFGSIPLNIRYTYSGHVKYTFSSQSRCNDQSQSDCSLETVKNEEMREINYRASFYSTEEKTENSIILTGNNNEADPLEIPEVLEGGSYNFTKFYMTDHVITCESAQKGFHTIHKAISNVDGKLNHGKISFMLPENDFEGDFELYMDFDTEEKYSASITLQPNNSGMDKGKDTHSFIFRDYADKSFTFKAEPYNGKVRYTLSGSRTTTIPCGSNTETIKAVIIRE